MTPTIAIYLGVAYLIVSGITLVGLSLMLRRRGK